MSNCPKSTNLPYFKHSFFIYRCLILYLSMSYQTLSLVRLYQHLPIPCIPTLAHLNARGALIVAISHPFPSLSTVIIYKKGGLRWFGVVCGGLQWFGVVCGISTVRFAKPIKAIALSNLISIPVDYCSPCDQRLCFRYIDSMIPLLSKSKISSL